MESDEYLYEYDVVDFLEEESFDASSKRKL